MVSRGSSSIVQSLLTFVLYVGAAVYFALFAGWNADTLVTLRLWGGASPVTHAVFYPVLTAFVAGFLLAAFLSSISALRRLAEIRRSKKQVAALQEELARLRSAAAGEVEPPLTAAG